MKHDMVRTLTRKFELAIEPDGKTHMVVIVDVTSTPTRTSAALTICEGSHRITTPATAHLCRELSEALLMAAGAIDDPE